jgi:purine-binding chemotaxis protein CheW
MEHVREVMRPCPLDRVERAPAYMLGLGLIRGEMVPVLDAAMLLSGSPAGGARFVVLRVGERRVALSVSDVLGVRALDEAELGELPPLVSAAADMVRAMAVLDGKLVEVLESARLVALAETDLAESEPAHSAAGGLS